MLDVLEIAKNNFSYSKKLNKIWQLDPADMGVVNKNLRLKFDKTISELAAATDDDESPPGWVVTGPAGSGKTHLLGSFCRQTQAHGGTFLLVDMTTVTDFWEKARFDFIRSICRSDQGSQPQIKKILKRVTDASQSGVDIETTAKLSGKEFTNAVQAVLIGLQQRHGHDVHTYQDIVRAAFMIASADFTTINHGNQWLLGNAADPAEYKKSGFVTSSAKAEDVVKGLSWLISLNGGFSVLALDQFDGIVKQYYLPAVELEHAENQVAKRIITGIGTGLLALHDYTLRCQIVVSCLFESWSCLTTLGLKSTADRYFSPSPLSRLTVSSQIESLIAARMKPAFDKAGKKPPYPSWPFPLEVLEGMKGDYPRAVLQKCHAHLERCLNAGAVVEYPVTTQTADDIEDVIVVPEPTPPTKKQTDVITAVDRQERFRTIDERFKKELADANAITRQDAIGYDEDFWGLALRRFAKAFCEEQGSLSAANLNVTGSDQYADAKYPLHVNLQYEAMDDKAEDRYLFLRAFTRPHHKTFLACLKSAKNLSGLEQGLPCRRLVLVDLIKSRQGNTTREELEKLEASEGFRIVPTDGDIRALIALTRTADALPDEWKDWAAHTKPTAKCGFLREHLNWFMGGATSRGVQSTSATQTAQATQVTPSTALLSPDTTPPVREEQPPVPGNRDGADAAQRIPVGKKTGTATGDVTLALETLKQHVSIFAGSGSGKTVLMRRLVEEAALCGVSAVVVDCGNDLARLGQPWSEQPEGWTEDDQKKADRYFKQVEVKIWTPGANEGNPLNFRKIPDLAAYADSEDELNEAVAISLGALDGLIPSIKNHQAKRGIVAECLRWMARNGGSDLNTLAGVMAELPDDCEAHEISPTKAFTWASELASQLRGVLATNPQLKSVASTDVATLLTGINDKPRISVINLAALGGKKAEQIFVNELAMALFDWIKRHPAQGLRGLFVLDEAKDFIPAQRNTPCRESVLRFVSQARKYGMGFVMATQEPKSVDNKAITSCNTQFFGRQNSPTDISSAEDLLQRHGVIGKLERGVFFLKSIEHPGQPSRIASRWCLSSHPPAPLDKSAVLRLARSLSE